ncbi:MAG: hypothetical protein WC822_07560 [Candidatus Paceibacterota bacterium]|jgi:hypothetical protein
MKKIIFGFMLFAAAAVNAAEPAVKPGVPAKPSQTMRQPDSSGGLVVISGAEEVADSTASASAVMQEAQDSAKVGVMPDTISDEPEEEIPPDAGSLPGRAYTLNEAVPYAFGSLKGVAPSGGSIFLFFEDSSGVVRVLQLKGMGSDKMSLEYGAEIQRSGQ